MCKGNIEITFGEKINNKTIDKVLDICFEILDGIHDYTGI